MPNKNIETYDELPLSILKEEDMLNFYVENITNENEIYKTRLKKIIKGFLTEPLLITNLKQYLYKIAENKWDIQKEKNQDLYLNLFERTCNALEENKDFESALKELTYIKRASKVIGDKASELKKAIVNYYQEYHTNKNTQRLVQERNIIANLTALYSGKCKDNFLSAQMKNLESDYQGLFTLDTNNSKIRKFTIEEKQREALLNKYLNNDETLFKQLDIIKQSFLKDINDDRVEKFIDVAIDGIITGKALDIKNLVELPPKLSEYDDYLKAKKIINRLNKGNITYEHGDVNDYKMIIDFNGKEYFYNGITFNEVELEKITRYKRANQIFNNLKSIILNIAKTININEEITEEEVKRKIKEIKFNDDFYKFNFESINQTPIKGLTKIIEKLNENPNIILNDKTYNNLYNLLIKNGFMQLTFSIPNENRFINNFEDLESLLYEIIENFDNITKYMQGEEFSIKNISKITKFNRLSTIANDKSLCMLNSEIIHKLDKQSNIERACDLVAQMPKRNKSTVPYINGQCDDYHYSIYTPNDESILTSGIDTHSCFQIGGKDNDFFHYCVLNDNGFVMKITDEKNNLIARASGFRNGNGVYINQLLSVYDDKIIAKPTERNKIINAFKKACEEIVEISQNNNAEENKIDFVIATQSHCLLFIKPNVSDDVKNLIGIKPMNITDWKNFAKRSINLNHPDQGYFRTDYGKFDLVCLASAIGEITPKKIKPGISEAKYLAPRREIKNTKANEEYINKINAIYAHQTNQPFKYKNINKDLQMINGENWYILYDGDIIIEKCCLKYDERALKEYNEVLNTFKKEEINESIKTR